LSSRKGLLASVIAGFRIKPSEIKIHRSNAVAFFCRSHRSRDTGGSERHPHRKACPARRRTVQKHQRMRACMDCRPTVRGCRRNNVSSSCFARISTFEVADGYFDLEFSFVFDWCPNQFRIWTKITQHLKIGLSGFPDSKSIPQRVGCGRCFCLGCPSHHGSDGRRRSVGRCQLNFHRRHVEGRDEKRNRQTKQAWSALGVHSASVHTRTILFR